MTDATSRHAPPTPPGALDLARDIARRAGHLLLDYAGRPHDVASKSTDIDLVTEADLASERLILDAIHTHYPDHDILAEESTAPGEGTARHRLQAAITDNRPIWLVDPLDGTVNYAHGYPVWAVSLALTRAGRVLLAVTYDPPRDELYWAMPGAGAWCNNCRLHTSTTPLLGRALVATGFAYRRATLRDNNLAEFSRMMPRVQGIRRAGAAALDLAHIAAARLDAYWEMHLQPWDWAAGWLLISEAGGTVTDLDGAPWTLTSTSLAASNGHLHAELLATLRPEAR
ncbi:MAG: inositol monophosphatase [Anaerolineae bacterium]|nr:inositol monophosphatase [Anaerolineae bacterium]